MAIPKSTKSSKYSNSTNTLTTSDWSNIKEKLPDFKPTFPKFKKVNPETYFKSFDRHGLDLCMKMLALDPARRISMK